MINYSNTGCILHSAIVYYHVKLVDQACNDEPPSQNALCPVNVSVINGKRNGPGRISNPENTSGFMQHSRSSAVDCSNASVSEAMRAKIKQEQEVSLAITLVAIAILFVCCQSVKLITDIYEMTYCYQPPQDTTWPSEQGDQYKLFAA